MSTPAGRSDLAVRALQLLARRAEGTSVDGLASALETTPDVVLDVLAPLIHAGWVERGAGGPDTFRYMRPKPAPTLHEVVEVVEGSTPIDDCVLRPGVSCAAFRAAPVCVAHADWLRELSANVLVPIPLAALLRPTGPGSWHASAIDVESRLSAVAEPCRDGREALAGGDRRSARIEVGHEPTPAAADTGRFATEAPPC